MNRVLIIGGTNFFGLRTVEKMVERGDEVTVFSRGHSRPEILSEVRHIEGDRENRDDLQRMLGSDRYDAVIDNVAYNGRQVRQVYDLLRGRTGQYIVCSSVAVYRHVPRYRVLYEAEVDLGKRLGEPYGDGKRELEQYLWDNINPDLPVTVFRPTVVEGPRDPAKHMWYYLQRFLDGGPVLLPSGIPDILLRIVFSDDLADAFIAAIGNAVTYNRVYNLGGEEIFTLSDYADMVRSAAGSSSEIVECGIDRINSAPGLSGYQPEYLGFDSVPDIGAARRDLGYRPAPVQQRIKQTAEWLVSLGSRPDSRGYASRRAEIEFARRLLRAQKGQG